MLPSDLGVFGALFDRFQELIGDTASVATFQFAGEQEGKRLAQGVPMDDVEGLMARIDPIMGQSSHIDKNGSGYRVQVAGSAFLSGGQPVLQGILLGVMQGAFQVACRRKFTVSIESAGDPAVVLVTEEA